jgi:predicted DNA-binding protein (MmcQ/YjbR family)
MDYDSLCDYLESKPAARKDMPFGPDALVFKVLDKMFALVEWQEEPITIALKADPVDVIIQRQQYDAVGPPRYLHKDHWNAITLDGSIPDEDVQRMIDDSYALVVQGMTRADQEIIKAQGWQPDGPKA